uniref:Palmitoyltransferase n=1 Tax=Daphnia sinensis TaxID=1820382 RepID=A0A4Y7N848_9CRUS|nr:EOG090X06RJ [Daphnia sinensis]SVE90526.1 EOG090X06RJ [Daphnia sinensis]
MRIISKLFFVSNFVISKITRKQIWKKVRQKIGNIPHLSIDWDDLTDRFIEPVIWVVDHFSDSLGKIFVSLVWLLILFVVGVAYWIGLSFYWNISAELTIALVIFGHWILLNVVFHYYMALITPPGLPPDAEQIPHIKARCKKCQSVKPERTHHCSICRTCILRMDHHCPWLNNCVGHFNHRYFFLFMAYVVLGMIFLFIFGAPVIVHELSISDASEQPIGYPVFHNGSHLLPVKQVEEVTPPRSRSLRRAVSVTVAILCAGILAALGALVGWHARLISKGETSIENLTNKDDREAKRLEGSTFVNPYDYGSYENWRIFLGLSEGRTWRCVFFPSVHPPRGDGISWCFKNDLTHVSYK